MTTPTPEPGTVDLGAVRFDLCVEIVRAASLQVAATTRCTQAEAMLGLANSIALAFASIGPKTAAALLDTIRDVGITSPKDGRFTAQRRDAAQARAFANWLAEVGNGPSAPSSLVGVEPKGRA